MRFIKIFVVLVPTVVALAGLAGSASGTTLTNSNGETTPTIHMVHEGTHISLKTKLATIFCNSTFEGSISKHGAGVTATGGVGTLSFTGCTNGWHVTVVSPGSFEIHYVSPGAGTFTSSGLTLSTTRLGVTCNFETNNTDIGTLTDGTKTATATLHLEGLLKVHTGSSGLCGSEPAQLEGDLSSTTTLILDA